MEDSGKVMLMWLSFHIYCGRDLYGPEIDQLLVDVVEPLNRNLRADGAVDRFFFVRYNDPDCHLRLRFRVQDVSGADGIALPDGTSFSIEQKVRRAVHAFDALARVQRIDYEPELQRYGGPQGIDIAEEHFHHSSQVALQLIAATLDNGRPQRLGKTLLTSVLLVFAWCRDRSITAKFLAGYAQKYRQYLTPAPGVGGDREDAEEQGLGERLAELGYSFDGHPAAAMTRALDALLTAATADEGLGIPLLDQWMAGLSTSTEGLQRVHQAGELVTSSELAEHQALQPMIGSFLHMHHNRLGLSIPQEIYLAHLAATALGANGEQR